MLRAAPMIPDPSGDKLPAETAAAGSLSARQREILALLTQGKSNKEIGQLLGLTTGTVKQHIYALFRKLGVRNRTMAAVRGAQATKSALPSGEAREPQNAEITTRSSPPTARETHYTRRLVTAVAIERRVRDDGAPDNAIEMESHAARLRERARQIAFDFDARFEPLPDGGAAVWFGQPVAHGDEATRAVAFVRALISENRSDAGAGCSIGIGTVPEVVDQSERSSLAFRAFRVAMLLSTFAEPGVPLACALTAELAGERTESGGPGATVHGDLPVAARTIGPEPAPSPAVARHWGGLPFVAELEMSARRGRCNWVAVESWPPEDATRLIQAIGESLAAKGLPAYRLWMPSSASGGNVAERLGGQLREEFLGHGRNFQFRGLHDGLPELGSLGPAVLLAYGIDAFPTLVSVLGAATLAQLRTTPIVIVAGAMHRAGAPQTAVRLVGSHPTGSPFVRVLRMTVPAPVARPPHGIRPGVQAVLDRVSPFARAVARAAAELRPTAIGPIALTLGVSSDIVAAGCRELQDAGIITMSDQTLQFRDSATADAIRASLVARIK